ncbi:MAG: hypothetical protein Q8R48_01355, partial [Candidatus Omnitrophota bacterium]|nr:hypothetical protein [Candidatus Omnitrophota bacterium]
NTVSYINAPRNTAGNLTGEAHSWYKFSTTPTLANKLATEAVKGTWGKIKFETFNIFVKFNEVFSLGIGAYSSMWQVHQESFLNNRMASSGWLSKFTWGDAVSLGAEVVFIVLTWGVGGGASSGARLGIKAAISQALKGAALKELAQAGRIGLAARLAYGATYLVAHPIATLRVVGSALYGTLTNALYTGRLIARELVNTFKAYAKGVAEAASRLREGGIVALREGAAKSIAPAIEGKITVLGMRETVKTMIGMGMRWMDINMMVYTTEALFTTFTTNKNFSETFNARDLMASARAGFVQGMIFAGIVRAVGFGSVFFSRYADAVKNISNAVGRVNVLVRAPAIIGTVTAINVANDYSKGRLNSREDLIRSMGKGALWGIFAAYLLSVKGLAHVQSLINKGVEFAGMDAG